MRIFLILWAAKKNDHKYNYKYNYKNFIWAPIYVNFQNSNSITDDLLSEFESFRYAAEVRFFQECENFDIWPKVRFLKKKN